MGKKFLGLFLGFTALFFLLGTRGAMVAMAKKAPPLVNELPEFLMTAVTRDDVAPLTKKDLAGRPWIANFIFTHCSGPCPLLSERMRELQEDLPSEVGLVSFTVDPDRDNPEVLRRYAQALEARSERWLFVTGPKSELYKLLYEGFRLPLAEDPRAASEFRITHTTKFALIDARGRVRGVFSSENESALKRLKIQAQQLSREEPAWPKKQSPSSAS